MSTSFPPDGLSLFNIIEHDEASLRAAGGDLYLLRHSSPPASLRPMKTQDVRVNASATTGALIFIVYAVRRQSTSEHSFISVGRVDGNDIVVRDETISKFHAFFRLTSQGAQLQDGRSHNGTFLDDKRVAPRGEGEPSPVRRGQTIRFGSISTVVLDAAGVIDLIRRAR